MNDFSSLNISDKLQISLSKMNLQSMTAIQTKSIPLALEGRDIIGCAQTGTGKTIAFLVPVIEKILKPNQNNQALILAPTRELASQIQSVIKQLLYKIERVSSVLLIGGASITKQQQAMRKNISIVVGTPGRILDHFKRKTLSLTNLKLLVLDESDRMLDMGFSVQLDNVLSYLQVKRQTLMFSATFSSQVLNLSKKYLENPEKVVVASATRISPKIKQDTTHTSNLNKYNELSNALDSREGSIIVFVNTKAGAERLSKKLLKNQYNICTLHGDVVHRKREKVIKNFRAKNYRIMIATDIASRGLDILHVQHVINYDLPKSHEDYIHRIGRTARANSSGSALNLVIPSEINKWNKIESFLNPAKKVFKKRQNTTQRSKFFRMRKINKSKNI